MDTTIQKIKKILKKRYLHSLKRQKISTSGTL